MPYSVTKKFGHELGLSACFRQWRAGHSHCRFLHGYALAVKLVVESDELDPRNWCFDFGGFKPIKTFLIDTFDHKMLVAADDPEKETLLALREKGLVQIKVLKAVGVEAFAEYIFENVKGIITSATGHRARLVSVTVSEHGANSATYSNRHAR